MNPDRVLFVYRRKGPPHDYEVRWIECAHQPNPYWTHVATIDPQRWIQYLLNSPDGLRDAAFKDFMLEATR